MQAYRNSRGGGVREADKQDNYIEDVGQRNAQAQSDRLPNNDLQEPQNGGLRGKEEKVRCRKRYDNCNAEI